MIDILIYLVIFQLVNKKFFFEGNEAGCEECAAPTFAACLREFEESILQWKLRQIRRLTAWKLRQRSLLIPKCR